MEAMMQKVLKHFNGEVWKAKLWFEIKNPVLHDVTPNQLIEWGQHERLNSIIDKALEEISHE